MGLMYLIMIDEPQMLDDQDINVCEHNKLMVKIKCGFKCPNNKPNQDSQPWLASLPYATMYQHKQCHVGAGLNKGHHAW